MERNKLESKAVRRGKGRKRGKDAKGRIDPLSPRKHRKLTLHLWHKLRKEKKILFAKATEPRLLMPGKEGRQHWEKNLPLRPDEASDRSGAPGCQDRIRTTHIKINFLCNIRMLEEIKYPNSSRRRRRRPRSRSKSRRRGQRSWFEESWRIRSP